MPGAARQIVKRAAAAVDSLVAPPPGITILIYHRVGRRTPVEVDLPTGLFREQMAWLRERCEVLTIDDALDRLAPGDADVGQPPVVPRVVVTFDDGTADFADEALPVLSQYQIPVTLYLATAFVEHGRMFPDDGKPLSWAALAGAIATGLVTVGSHTHTHVLLDRAHPGTVRTELDRSRGLIQERLGVVADHFAYPKAVAGTDSAQQEVRRRFRSAALAGTRPNRYRRADPYRLRRSPIQVSDGMQWFERKVRGGMWAEDALRHTINRVRYRGETR